MRTALKILCVIASTCVGAQACAQDSGWSNPNDQQQTAQQVHDGVKSTLDSIGSTENDMQQQNSGNTPPMDANQVNDKALDLVNQGTAVLNQIPTIP